MTQPISGTMEMISGRVPEGIYKWFAALQIDGAVTNSDKLRVLFALLKKQHEGSMDYVSALAWFRDLTGGLRQSLATVERYEGVHSEVVSVLTEHLSALAAMLVSNQPATQKQAMGFEDALVKRVFAMNEALFRQAITPSAAAFEPSVVRRYSKPSLELAGLIQTLNATSGVNNG
jgi:hypothetical protein